MIMTLDDSDDQRRLFNSEQRADARNALGFGVPVRRVAEFFGLTELELRRELGLPQWTRPPQAERQKSLFDERGQV